MGHPYNQTQKIEIKNLSAQRFVGTDIQKNLFYGRDDTEFEIVYTGLAQRVYWDYASNHYELLTSGDFVRLYTGEFGLKAEYTGNVRGESIDYPVMSTTPYGVQDRFPFDYPVLAPQPSGYFEPVDLDIFYERLELTGADVVRIDYDRPYNRAYVPSSGSFHGIKWDDQKAKMFFETGEMWKGRIEHTATMSDGAEVANKLQYAFVTGRYDGGLS